MSDDRNKARAQQEVERAMKADEDAYSSTDPPRVGATSNQAAFYYSDSSSNQGSNILTSVSESRSSNTGSWGDIVCQSAGQNQVDALVIFGPAPFLFLHIRTELLWAQRELWQNIAIRLEYKASRRGFRIDEEDNMLNTLRYQTVQADVLLGYTGGIMEIESFDQGFIITYCYSPTPPPPWF